MSHGQEAPATAGSSAGQTTNMVMFPFMLGSSWGQKFSGDKSQQHVHFQEWVRAQRIMLDMQMVSESQKVSMLLSNLDGEAKREVLALLDTESKTAEQVLTFLEGIYGYNIPLALLRSQFFGRKQRSQESVRQFALALQEFSNRLQKQGDTTNSGHVLRDQFILGLLDPVVRQELRVRVRMEPNLSFTEAKQEAIWRSEEYVPSEQVVASAVQVSQKPSAVLNFEKVREEIRQEVQKQIRAEITDIVSSVMQEVREGLQARDLQFNSSVQRKSDVTVRSSATGRRSSDQYDGQGRPICRRCKNVGHIERRC